MDFWDFFWLMVWWFFFVMYLVLLFQIIGDIFRDRSLGGFAKAIWILALFVVPFLSALIYLIARGNGMAERRMVQAADSQAAVDDYIRNVAGATPSASAEITQAKALLDSGAIDQNEYNALKAKALA